MNRGLDGHDPDLAALRRCFVALPKDDQTVLAMHYFLGLRTAEVASLMDTTRGAVLARLCRARKRLRKLMEES
ncbi:MAG: sigma-70 family RNA polymerase sigma factor [Phycisphaerae bacterium]|nr:sigma-70 family RNA polymerase sigma factor [Phycisphaerae bacterium]